MHLAGNARRLPPGDPYRRDMDNVRAMALRWPMTAMERLYPDGRSPPEQRLGGGDTVTQWGAPRPPNRLDRQKQEQLNEQQQQQRRRQQQQQQQRRRQQRQERRMEEARWEAPALEASLRATASRARRPVGVVSAPVPGLDAEADRLHLVEYVFNHTGTRHALLGWSVVMESSFSSKRGWIKRKRFYSPGRARKYSNPLQVANLFS